MERKTTSIMFVIYQVNQPACILPTNHVAHILQVCAADGKAATKGNPAIKI
jgi:hypothetical protein